MKFFPILLSIFSLFAAVARPAVGQTLGTTPTTIATLTNVPTDAATITTGNTPTSLRFGPNGQLYDSDGANIWEQTAGLSGSFTKIGTIPSIGSDPGAINFTSNGQTIMVSNGAGGSNTNTSNGFLYTAPLPIGTSGPGSPVPSAAKIGTVANNYDFIPTPSSSTFTNASTSFLVDLGTNGGNNSEVDVFNSATGSDVPVIQSIPGASASLAISGNNLYVGVGFGNSQGEIETFNLSTLATAAKNNSAVNWSSGTVVNPSDFNNSGSGMFVDPRGYIFTGGPNGIEVIASSVNSIVYGIPYDVGGDQMTFTNVTYSPITNQFTVQGYNAASSAVTTQTNVYSASQFATTNLLYWIDTAANNTWDTSQSQNWSNNGSNAFFSSGDTVIFADKNPNTNALVPNSSGKVTITVSASGGVQPAAVMFTNTGASHSGIDYTLQGGAIGGAATIELYGNGTTGGMVTFTNSNTYTGATIVAAGTLNLQNALALGNSSGVNVIAGTQLQLQSSSGTPTFGLTATGSHSIPLNLYGTGLTSGGASTAPGELNNVSGNNTYGGAVNIGAGGGQIVSTSTSGSLTLSGGMNIAAGTTAIFPGPGMTTLSAGGLSIGNSGSLRVSSGTVRVGLASGTVSLGTATSATISPGATLQLQGTVSGFSDSSSGNRVNIVNTGSPGLVVASGKQSVGTITGTSSKSNGATVYSGVTTVSANATLNATQILQNSLIIGAGATVSILPSSGSGPGIATNSSEAAAAEASSSSNANTSNAVIQSALAASNVATGAGASSATVQSAAFGDTELELEIQHVQSRVTTLSNLAAENSMFQPDLQIAENSLASLQAELPSSTSEPSASFGLLLASGEASGASVAAVPEPKTFWLGLIAGMIVGLHAYSTRRRRMQFSSPKPKPKPPNADC